jgi:hypothetical protein
MTSTYVVEARAPRAIRAAEAGSVLAHLMGLSDPIPATKMWYLARKNVVKTIKCGRLRYFRTTDLEQFVIDGGRGFDDRRTDS